MGKVGFMLLGGVIAIAGLGVLILITTLVGWIQDKIIMHKINKKNNLNHQLEKAKEVIKKFVEFVNLEVEYDPEHPQEHTNKWNELCEQAEQFLKEIKEK